ncbi:unnamed protein product [Ambrosiozyma monospora]|uniref:Unnamed protein product n=1 Tax=Ambrosiozyma monospora TaxID=43982 RepID=A0ACB5TL05_AMBMO|nr:unnamed protein product [Ambrosiozyma monospora]
MTQSQFVVSEKLDYIHVPNKESNLPYYSDKVILPQSILETLVSQQKALDLPALPHPLIFKISSPTTVCYAGVQEFISDEGEIKLSGLLLEKFGIINNSKENGSDVVSKSVSLPLQVELTHDVPKGTSLSLKPLEIYDVTNWKWFLEAKLSSCYTTLTQGDLLHIKDENNGQIYKLEVNKTEPSQTICVIDTDINLDVEPLDDEMAKALLEKRNHLDKFENLPLDKPLSIPVGQKLRVELDDLKKDVTFVGNGDFIVSNNECIAKDSFIWSTLNSGVKTVKVSRSDPNWNHTLYVIPIGSDLETASIEVRTHVDEEEDQENENQSSTAAVASDPDHVICINCGSEILKSSQFMHENFCRRNNVKCSKGCNKIFLKQIPSSHWHCCSTWGDSPESLKLHQQYLHSLEEGPITCPQCHSYKTSPQIDLAFHIATECPESKHECQFCHLILPKGEHPSPESKFSGLTAHEYSCGSKTTECFKCGKVVRQREFGTHFALHEMARRSKPTPLICHNVNCQRYVDKN